MGTQLIPERIEEAKTNDGNCANGRWYLKMTLWKEITGARAIIQDENCLEVETQNDTKGIKEARTTGENCFKYVQTATEVLVVNNKTVNRLERYKVHLYSLYSLNIYRVIYCLLVSNYVY